jgi:hypothetical protein
MRRPTGVAFVVATLAAASMWFYADQILVKYQVAEAAAHGRPRGNLSDLYPRWLGARELLLHHRNPYSDAVAVEIQKGYYGRALDPARAGDPQDRQGFAYPVYVVFLLAPLIRVPFPVLQAVFPWLLAGLTAATVLLWLRALAWRSSAGVVAIATVLMLGSVATVQGIKLQQLSLVVAALLAGAAACVTSGLLFWGGVLLALATIKPQLAWPMVAWMLLWGASDWRGRRSVVFGFGMTMTVLMVGAEILLPRWLGMFVEAIRQYHQYTHNQSVMDELLNGTVGRMGGVSVNCLAVLISAFFWWRLRREPAGSAGYSGALALTMALTVLVVPMDAPYNQVLMLPAVLQLVRERRGRDLRTGRFVYAVGVLFLGWQWMASAGLSIGYWLISPAWALKNWGWVFFATFALPVLVFSMTLLDSYAGRRPPDGNLPDLAK